MLLVVRPIWKHYRVVHSKYPPINLFETVSKEDAYLLGELESVTNDRLNNWSEFVHPEDLKTGVGWSAVMAAFCYFSPGRFNTNQFGAYYCASNIETAVKEWSFHTARTWKEFQYTNDASATVRTYVGNFKKDLVDVRKNRKAHAKDCYEYSQTLASKHRLNKEFGILFKSVRSKDGECAAILRPSGTSKVIQKKHYVLKWNGAEFTEFAEIGDYIKLT